MSSPATSETPPRLPIRGAVVGAWRLVDRALGQLLRVFVLLYRWLLSPLLPPACRFYPSCSAYADEALATHGLVRGGSLTGARLLRCHPLCEGGHDPVPPMTEERPCAGA